MERSVPAFFREECRDIKNDTSVLLLWETKVVGSSVHCDLTKSHVAKLREAVKGQTSRPRVGRTDFASHRSATHKQRQPFAPAKHKSPLPEQTLGTHGSMHVSHSEAGVLRDWLSLSVHRACIATAVLLALEAGTPVRSSRSGLCLYHIVHALTCAVLVLG